MKAKSVLAILTIAATIVAVSCSIWKKNDSEEDVRAFLATFQSSLSLSDEEILKQFDANQSPEALRSAIRVFKNTENEFILCTLAFDQAQITKGENGNFNVVIPTTFTTKGIEREEISTSSVTLSLELRKKSFVIISLDGDDFYKAFALLRNSIQWETDRAREMASRAPIYARAKELQQDVDSVIWYSTYEGKNYYYVVKGKWTNYFYNGERPTNYTMGLIDESGAEILPAEFQLIGTIGFDFPNVVEVKKDDHYGYFDISKKQFLIQPEYSMIIPYADGATQSFIVKRDTLYKILDGDRQYQEVTLSRDASEWIREFKFLPESLRLIRGAQSFSEIPAADHAGYGIVMPPSYLVASGLFEEIEGGLSTTEFPLNGYTEYKETSKTIFERVTSSINALMTTITDRYLDGREEFYSYNKLVFVDHKNDTLAVTRINAKNVMHLKRIGNYIEIKSHPEYDWEPYPTDDAGLPEYSYFILGQRDSIHAVKSNRIFASTEFIKLDSTYLTGEFQHWEDDNQTTTNFVSLATLNYMRNEILASNGFRLQGSDAELFAGISWYKPQFDSIDDVKSRMSEVDLYNIQFLDRLIALMATPST